MECLPIHTVFILLLSPKAYILLEVTILNLTLESLEIGSFHIFLINRVQEILMNLHFRRRRACFIIPPYCFFLAEISLLVTRHISQKNIAF